jgi:hypothetical protein
MKVKSLKVRKISKRYSHKQHFAITIKIASKNDLGTSEVKMAFSKMVYTLNRSIGEKIEQKNIHKEDQTLKAHFKDKCC